MIVQQLKQENLDKFKLLNKVIFRNILIERNFQIII